MKLIEAKLEIDNEEQEVEVKEIKMEIAIIVLCLVNMILDYLIFKKMKQLKEELSKEDIEMIDEKEEMEKQCFKEIEQKLGIHSLIQRKIFSNKALRLFLL